MVCRLEGIAVLVDGFKRLHAAGLLKGVSHLQARLLEVNEQGAKAAVFNLNRIAGRPVELEKAWINYALVREDGLQQVEAARLLGRHKSWVNRRLALIERLCDEAREEKLAIIPNLVYLFRYTLLTDYLYDRIRRRTTQARERCLGGR